MAACSSPSRTPPISRSTFGLANGVTLNQPPRLHVVGSLLRTQDRRRRESDRLRNRDSLAVYSDDGASFSMTNVLGARRRAVRGFGVGARDGARHSRRPGCPQGRPRWIRATMRRRGDRCSRGRPHPSRTSSCGIRCTIIPPAQRPRVVLRFSDQRDLLASGLLDGNTVAQRPVVVDAPLGKGHVVLFANNPMWRGETIGSYFLVFNTILNFDNLDAGKKLDTR